MLNNLLRGKTINSKRRLKKPIRQLHPLNQEKSYQKDLRAIVNQIKKAVQEYLIPQLPYLLHDVHKNKSTALRDDIKSDTDRIFEKIKSYLDKNIDEEHIAQLHAVEVNKFQSAQWRKQIMHMFDVNIFTNEPWLKDHLDAWIAANVGLIKSLEDTALSQVQYQVQQGFVQGLRPESISKNIQERLGVAESRADLIGRDQVSKLNGQLNQLRQTDLGITQYKWTTAHDERVRESHEELDGEIFDWDDPPDEGNPGEPVNCFLGNTEFRSLINVKKLFRRWYDGKTTKIITGFGKSFECTVNHPIFTERGIVAAQDLKIGDNIFCIGINAIDVLDTSKSNIENFKPTFEQVFNFLSIIFPVDRIDGTTEQFHGDGIIDQYVDIIRFDACLLDDGKPIFNEDICEKFFTFADMSLKYLPSDRHISNCLRALGFTSNSFVSFFSKIFSIFQTHILEPNNISLRTISDLNVIFNKPFHNGSSGNSIFFGKRKYANPTEIIFDKTFFIEILKIMWGSMMMNDLKTIITHQNGKSVGIAFKSSSDFGKIHPVMHHFISVVDKIDSIFHGYVYNAETFSNSYIINDNLLVSNCRCIGIPVFSEDLLGESEESEE